MRLTAHRAAYWVERRTLLVADLHLGKAEAFQRHGVLAPSGAMHETLDRLGAAIVETGAARVLVLGDLLHAPVGITKSMVESVEAWRARVDVEIGVVVGNHDRAIGEVAGEWKIEVLGESYVDRPFVFRHEAACRDANGSSAGSEAAPTFEWSGHVHPALVMRRRGCVPLKLACYVVGTRRGVLPAFSAFTAGATIAPGVADRVFAIADEDVVEITRASEGPWRGR